MLEDSGEEVSDIIYACPEGDACWGGGLLHRKCVEHIDSLEACPKCTQQREEQITIELLRDQLVSARELLDFTELKLSEEIRELSRLNELGFEHIVASTIFSLYQIRGHLTKRVRILCFKDIAGDVLKASGRALSKQKSQTAKVNMAVDKTIKAINQNKKGTRSIEVLDALNYAPAAFLNVKKDGLNSCMKSTTIDYLRKSFPGKLLCHVRIF